LNGFSSELEELQLAGHVSPSAIEAAAGFEHE